MQQRNWNRHEMIVLYKSVILISNFWSLNVVIWFTFRLLSMLVCMKLVGFQLCRQLDSAESAHIHKSSIIFATIIYQRHHLQIKFHIWLTESHIKTRLASFFLAVNLSRVVNCMGNIASVTTATSAFWQAMINWQNWRILTYSNHGKTIHPIA